MNTIFSKIINLKNYIVAHKMISTIVIIAISFGGYEIIKKIQGSNTNPSYLIEAVQKGTIVSSITGSGQVSAENQVDLKSKTSGDVLSVNVVSGQSIKAGTLIARIDARDAEIALENARIALQKLTQPADALSVTLAQDQLAHAYDNGFNTAARAFIDLPAIMTGLDDLFYTKGGYLSDQRSFPSDADKSDRDIVGLEFDGVKAEYNTILALYKSTMRTDTAATKALISTTYNLIQHITQTIKDSKALVDHIALISSGLDTSATAVQNLNSWTDTMNTDLLNLLSVKNTITEQTDSLSKLQNGPDPLDVRSQQLNVTQKEYAYQDSFIYAPFDGVVAKITVKKTDSVSSGTSIGTFITKQKIANVSLNEVDVAKVKTGEKATLTFDAVDGLSIAGTVLEVDLVGTVTQGVVNYNVKIGFDTSDDRIKSGMSVSAAIITDVKQDVLIVPNSAIKIQGTNNYVEIFDKSMPVTTGNQGVISSALPIQQAVVIGAFDDFSTEIISGLSEGDKIVTRTIAPSTTVATSTAPSLFGSIGGSRNTGAGASTRSVTGR